MFPRVAVIILNWNGWEDTIECVESLNNIEYPNFDTIIVDNGSTDNSIEKIKRYCNGDIIPESNYFKYSNSDKPIKLNELVYKNNQFNLEYVNINSVSHENSVLLIKNDQNFGFTEGNNIAIRFAMKYINPEYFLLLNNDTVVEKKFLDELINVALKESDTALLGPKIYCYDNNKISNLVSFAGGNINLNTCQPHPIGDNEIDNGQFDIERKVDYVEGSCLLVKNELVNKIGFLDKEYFTYWEEIDWCIRGKNAGYDCMYVPNAMIWHKGYGSEIGTNSMYYMIRNRFLFMKKNTKSLQTFSSLTYYFGYYFWIILFSVTIFNHDKNKSRSFLKGTLDGIRSLN